MGGQALRPRDRAAAKALAAIEELLHDYHPRDFAIEFWEGTRLPPDAGQFCRFTWHINHPAALRAALRSEKQVAMGEAFARGDFDISGDILAIFPLAEYLSEKHWRASEKLRLASLLLGLPLSDRESPSRVEVGGKIHSKARDRQAVTFHYDVSNEFYKLWLDRRMVHSCAYFESPDDNIDAAQQQKLDYICRKLRLRPGERLLDIGCGWGGLILYACVQYGVQAVGITLSENQAGLAKERILAAGAQDRCEVRVLDYRDAAALGRFGKIVSVGMVEHVGESELAEYFRVAFSLLEPKGVFLNHGIGRAPAIALNRPKKPLPTYMFSPTANWSPFQPCFFTPNKPVSKYETLRTCASTIF